MDLRAQQLASEHALRLAESERAAREASAAKDPKLPGEASAQPSPSSVPPPRRGSEQPRILLVEDHADTVDVLTDLLESHGYKVQSAMSLREAREVDLAQVDVIVSDLRLPDGTGLELMRELRERARVPAIALSGFGMQADLQASKEAGFDVHLTKPVNIERLLEAIQRLSRSLHEPEPTAPGSPPFQ